MSPKKISLIPISVSIFLILLNSYFGFWWINLLIAFCISYLFISRLTTAFLLFFTLLFILWLGTSFYKDQQVSNAVSLFLSGIAGDINPNITYLITGLTGGILTGWAGLLGSSLRKITTPKINV